ncbi:MAG: ATP-binding protein, partial [Clostridia bacterium]|nr:ATP-binding protein [Clostridia bacterium]
MPQTDIKELNFLATSAPEKMVLDAERTYFDKIEKIASQIINNPQLKLILLAGPSGSGKTTTANLLADKLRSMQTEA